MTNEELKNITISPEEIRETTYFKFGTHEIVISKVKIDKHEDKPFAEIFVENDVAEDRARLWLHTPDTRRISIDTVRKILIHNQKDEEIKQKIREKFQQIKNLADFAALLKKTVGCAAWFKVSEDETRTYQKDGEIKKSINRRIYSYEPKSDAEVKTSGKDAEIPDNFDQEVDLSDIPF